MKLIKDKIIKEVEDRIVGDYISAGWKIFKGEIKEKPLKEFEEEKPFAEKKYSRFRKEE